MILYFIILFIDPFLLLSIFLLLKARRKRYGTDTFPKSFFIERTTFRKAADSTKKGPEFEFRWGTRVCLCRGRYGTVRYRTWSNLEENNNTKVAKKYLKK